MLRNPPGRRLDWDAWNDLDEACKGREERRPCSDIREVISKLVGTVDESIHWT